jgi:pyruvate ferredoxin oxidoreductase gamma subunit
LAGKEIQAFPEYGPERRGAPVRAFVRISDKPIRTSSTITEPNFVIVIDPGLFSVMPELNNYTCPIIVNTNKDKKVFKVKTKEIYVVDATKISLEQLKSNNPNTVLIGVLLKLTKVIKFEDVKKVIEEEFTKKNKKELIEPNINCLKIGKEVK